MSQSSVCIDDIIKEFERLRNVKIYPSTHEYIHAQLCQCPLSLLKKRYKEASKMTKSQFECFVPIVSIELILLKADALLNNLN